MNTKILFSVVLASTLMIQGCGLQKVIQDAINQLKVVQTVTGTVTLADKTDYSGTKIEMNGRTTQTDVNGHFQLAVNGSPAQSVNELVISHTGYVTENVTVPAENESGEYTVNELMTYVQQPLPTQPQVQQPVQNQIVPQVIISGIVQLPTILEGQPIYIYLKDINGGEFGQFNPATGLLNSEVLVDKNGFYRISVDSSTTQDTYVLTILGSGICEDVRINISAKNGEYSLPTIKLISIEEHESAKINLGIYKNIIKKIDFQYTRYYNPDDYSNNIQYSYDLVNWEKCQRYQEFTGEFYLRWDGSGCYDSKTKWWASAVFYKKDLKKVWDLKDPANKSRLEELQENYNKYHGL